jgi:hypothetical protein
MKYFTSGKNLIEEFDLSECKISQTGKRKLTLLYKTFNKDRQLTISAEDGNEMEGVMKILQEHRQYAAEKAGVIVDNSFEAAYDPNLSTDTELKANSEITGAIDEELSPAEVISNQLNLESQTESVMPPRPPSSILSSVGEPEPLYGYVTRVSQGLTGTHQLKYYTLERGVLTCFDSEAEPDSKEGKNMVEEVDLSGCVVSTNR